MKDFNGWSFRQDLDTWKEEGKITDDEVIKSLKEMSYDIDEEKELLAAYRRVLKHTIR